jgi:hypothetical protein
LSVQAVNGVAEFDGLTINKPGTGYVINASSSSLPNAASAPFDVTNDQLAVTTQVSAAATAGSGFGLVVSAETSAGTVDTTFSGNVTLSLINYGSNNVAIEGTLTVAAVKGVATFSGISIGQPGSYAIQASGTSIGGGVSDLILLNNGVVAAPTLTVPFSATVTENKTLSFTGANAITIADTGGSQESVTLTVSNGKLSVGSVSGITVTGNGSSTLKATGALTGINSLLAGLVYSPTAAFTGTDSLAVAVTDTANSLINAASTVISVVSPTGTTPQLSVSGNSVAVTPNESPEPVNGTLFGSTATTQTFTITNTGAGTLTLSGTSPVSVSGTNAANFVVTEPSVKSLAAGASTTFQVKYTPSGSGTLTATLSIASNDPNSPFKFGLQGTAVSTQSDILDDTSSVDVTFSGAWTEFTQSGVGFDNTQHYVAPGNGSATASYAFSGLAPGEYQVLATWPAASNHASNVPFAFYNGANASTPAGGVIVNESVAPTANGLNGFQILGTVDVTGNAMQVVIGNNANNYVIADAVELVPAATVTSPQLSVSGHSLPIVPSEASETTNGTLFGSTSSSQTFTITNTGAGTLTLTGASPVSVSGANASNFVVTQPSVTSLAAGASTTFQVKYTPSGNGTLNATLSIASNDAHSPFKFGLQGTSVSTQSTFLDDSSSSVVFSGGWGSTTGGYSNSQHYTGAGSGSATATYPFTSLATGEYNIYATWTVASNHASNAAYAFSDGSKAVGADLVNQAKAPTANGPNGFQLIGTALVTSGTLNVTLSNNANNYVVADAIEIAPATGSGELASAGLVDDNANNASISYSGAWGEANGYQAYNNSQHYVAATGTSSSTATATYVFSGLATNAQYAVYATWPGASNHGSNMGYTIYDSSTKVGSGALNEQGTLAVSSSGVFSGFQDLTPTPVAITSGTLKFVISNANNAGQYVIADAVQIAEVVPAAKPAVKTGDSSVTVSTVSATTPVSGNGSLAPADQSKSTLASSGSSPSGAMLQAIPADASTTGALAASQRPVAAENRSLDAVQPAKVLMVATASSASSTKLSGKSLTSQAVDQVWSLADFLGD